MKIFFFVWFKYSEKYGKWWSIKRIYTKIQLIGLQTDAIYGEKPNNPIEAVLIWFRKNITQINAFGLLRGLDQQPPKLEFLNATQGFQII